MVDDEASALRSLERGLSRELPEYRLLTAETQIHAFATAKEERPEVAVLDLSLVPEEGPESGFALLADL